MELLDSFVSDWPDAEEPGFGYAVGPTFMFSDGRVTSVGKHAWQA